MLCSVRSKLIACAVVLCCASTLAAQTRCENLLLVSLDGLRWQDVFGGADARFLHAKHGGVKDLIATEREFRRDTPEEGRRILMPFLWEVIAKQGQIFGDPARDAAALATNGLKFSYPGYHEFLCGFADARIDSNAKRVNPNQTVLEYLNGLDRFHGRVAVFSGWDVHPFIVAHERAALFVQSAWELPTIATSAERLEWLHAAYRQLPREWPGFCFDLLTFQAAKEYMVAKKPKVLYLALGETDEWAHSRRYDLYLQMARTADAYLRELWELVQSMDEYRDRTALLITVDHGRGRNENDWTDHGEKVEGAEEVWMAVMGPQTPALGVRANVRTTLSQIAATAAALLGEDYNQHEPRAAAVLPGVIDGRMR